MQSRLAAASAVLRRKDGSTSLAILHLTHGTDQGSREGRKDECGPLTAYLATSPGGADSVAIIAASAHVEISFVMAMQLARFLVAEEHPAYPEPVEEPVKALTD